MAKLEDKLAAIIRRRLRNADIDSETLPDGQVVGHVIASEFKGKSYEARHRRIAGILEAELSPSERGKVNLLLTYSPEEWFNSDESHPWELDRIRRLGAGGILQFDRKKGGKCILDRVDRHFDASGRLMVDVQLRDRATNTPFSAGFTPAEFMNERLVRDRLESLGKAARSANRSRRNGSQRVHSK